MRVGILRLCLRLLIGLVILSIIGWGIELYRNLFG